MYGHRSLAQTTNKASANEPIAAPPATRRLTQTSIWVRTPSGNTKPASTDQTSGLEPIGGDSATIPTKPLRVPTIVVPSEALAAGFARTRPSASRAAPRSAVPDNPTRLLTEMPQAKRTRGSAYPAETEPLPTGSST